MIWSVDVPEDLAGLGAEDAAGLLAAVEEHLVAVGEIRDRLRVLVDTPPRVVAEQSAFLDARDGVAPAAGADVGAWPEYRQPAGAHDAYPAGRVVRWLGRLYRATRDGVAHSPVVSSDWVDVTYELAGSEPEPEPVASRGEWDPAATYAIGDTVTRGGVMYRCRVPHGAEYQGTWAPGVAWGVWELAW